MVKDNRSFASTKESIAALHENRARQDAAILEAASRLRARVRGAVLVSREALEEIDRACLVPNSSLEPTALRG